MKKQTKKFGLFTALVLLCLSMASGILMAQDRELKTEDDGFQWYRLEQNGKYGAQSKGGVTFIPLSRGYTFICYLPTNGGWFTVKKGDKHEGVCDITGREIVAPGRYDHAYYRNEDGFEYVRVELNGKYGVCDINGREVIAPRYESVIYSDGVFQYKDASGNWVSTGIKLSSLAQTPSANPTPSPSPSPTPQPQPQPQSQPVRQPQPFQVWQACFMCGGSGQCRYCYNGWAANGKDRCGICNGTGKCSQCAGHGGQNVIEYR